MNILVIDAQGGGVGKQLVSAIRQNIPEVFIAAVGTNSVATSAMLKAGADNAATGENAVIVACRKADIIVGPVGIVIADSLFGEITPAMAAAVGQSAAKRVLIPFQNCDNIIIGAPDYGIGKFVQNAVEAIQKVIDNR